MKTFLNNNNPKDKLMKNLLYLSFFGLILISNQSNTMHKSVGLIDHALFARLTIAVQEDDSSKIMRAVLDSRAHDKEINVDQLLPSGKTLLISAVEEGKEYAVSGLLWAGANPNYKFKDQTGKIKTALDFAYDRPSVQDYVIFRLIEKGALPAQHCSL